MSWWFDAIATRAGELALIATVILAVGCVAALWLGRSATSRQAWCEWTAMVAFAWLIAAVIPAPRLVGPAASVAIDAEAATATATARRSMASPPAARPSGNSSASLPGSPAARDAGWKLVGPVRRASPAPLQRRSAPSTAAAVGSSSPVGPWLAGAWALWAVGALLWSLWGLLGLRRLLRDPVAVRTIDPALRARVRRAHPRASIVVSHRANRPFVCGLWRPRVVIPAELIADARDRATLEHVLAHECAHLAHGDLVGRYLFAVAGVLLGWHPLLWWLRARARLAAELRADAAAAGTAPASYARHLIDYASRAAAPSLPAAARPLAAFTTRSEFVRRMQMLLERRTAVAIRESLAPRFARWALAPLLVVGSAGLFGVPLPAQDPGQELKALRRENRELRQVLVRQEQQISVLTSKLQAFLERFDAETRGAEKVVVTELADVTEAVETVKEEVAEVVEVADEVEVEEPVDSPFVTQREDVVVDELVTESGRLASPSAARARPNQAVPSSLEVMELASRALGLQAVVRESRERLSELEPLVKDGYAPKQEQTTAVRELELALQRDQLIRQLIEIEIEALDAEIAIHKTLLEGGRVPARGLQRLLGLRKVLAGVR